MRDRRREFVMTAEEAADLERKAEMASMSQSRLLRLLIAGYHPPEAPPPIFYEDMSAVLATADRMVEVARKAHDAECKRLLRKEADELRDMRMEILRKYLSGERKDMKWQ